MTLRPAAFGNALRTSAASVRRRLAADFYDQEMRGEEPRRALSEGEKTAQYKSRQSLPQKDWRKGRRGRQQEELLSRGAQKMGSEVIDRYEGPRESERSRKEAGRVFQRQPEISGRREYPRRFLPKEGEGSGAPEGKAQRTLRGKEERSRSEKAKLRYKGLRVHHEGHLKLRKSGLRLGEWRSWKGSRLEEDGDKVY